MKIEIDWLTDSYDNCETCGPSYAEGAKVFIDGVLTIDMAPSAHCFGGNNYYQSDVYDAILKWLGHEIAEREDIPSAVVGERQ